MRSIARTLLRVTAWVVPLLGWPGVAGAQPCGHLADSAARDAAQASRWAEGRRHHDNACAREGSQPPDFNAALTEYERAYALYEGHPERYRLLGNIGRSYQSLGRTAQAVEAYQRFLATSPPATPSRARVEGLIQGLEATLAVVVISSNVPGAEVWIDQRPSGHGVGRVRVPAGRHTIELRAPGHAPATREVNLSPQQVAHERVDLEPLGRRGWSPVYFWVGVGLTGGAVVAGSVFGVRALNLRSDVDQRLESPDPRVRFSVTRDEGPRIAELALVADIFFGSAVALAAATTVLYFMTDFQVDRRRARLRPWVLPTLSGELRGVVLGGAF